MTPNVLFSVEYHACYKPGSAQTDFTKKRDFVTCKSAGANLINYLLRTEAISKDSIETTKIVDGLIDKTTMSQKDMLSYASNRPGSTGAFGANGDLNLNDIKKIRGALRRTKSTVWTTVISFEDAYGKSLCANKAVAQDIVTSQLHVLFKNTPLNFDNIDWYAAHHTNTDNRHIHLVFWEKSPTFTKKNKGGLHFSNFKKFKPADMDNFKFALARKLEDTKSDNYALRDILRLSLKTNLKKMDYASALNNLRAKFQTQKRYVFGALTPELQKDVLDFAFDIINTKNELAVDYEKYKTELYNLQKKYLKICKDNKLKPSEEVKNFVNNRINDLHQRIGNDVCQIIKSLNKDIRNINYNKSTNEIIAENKLKLTENDNFIISALNNNAVTELYEGKYIQKELLNNEKIYKNNYAAVKALVNEVSLHTKNREQIKRIAFSSALYTKKLEYVKADNINPYETKKSIFDKLVDNTLKSNDLKIKEQKSSNRKTIIRNSVFVGRVMKNVLFAALNSLCVKIDASFSTFQTNLKEQEYKRKIFENENKETNEGKNYVG